MSYSPLIHAAQIGLKSLGFNPGDLDGFDGKDTQAALTAWQQSLAPPSGLDTRSAATIRTLDPKAQPIFTAFLTKAKVIAATFGCDYKAISGNRTFAEQDALYAQGRSAPGKVVTNARAGQSNHNFGIAVDCGVFKAGAYVDDADSSLADKVHKTVATQLADEFKLEWGGDWVSIKDFPHFEIRTPYSLFEKRQRILAGKSVLA